MNRPADTAIHVVTPIISRGFRNDAPLMRALPPDAKLTSVFLRNGPASVESAVDEALAAPGVIDAAIAAERRGADAVVIDCMLDPGLEAAREAVGIPVIGCGEAAFRHAATFGPFTVITVLDRQARAFGRMARLHALDGALKNVRAIGVPVLALEQDAERAFAATLSEARAAMQKDGARAVVFGCTGMLGFGEKLAAELDNAIEVVDPLPLAVAKAHEAAARGEFTDKTLYPSPERKSIAGFDGWPELVNTMREGGSP